MFSDKRSKRLIFVSHCVLNQNSISDDTADFPGTFKEIVELLLGYDIGIVQLPCPELMCLGLDRGDIHGADREVVTENTRIRKELTRSSSTRKLRALVDQVIFQIEEYTKNGFTLLGVVGMDRSPSCGVDTTSMDNQEVAGRGVFVQALSSEFENRKWDIQMVGIKSSEIDASVAKVSRLLNK